MAVIILGLHYLKEEIYMTTSLWKHGAIGSHTSCIPPLDCGVGTRNSKEMPPL